MPYRAVHVICFWRVTRDRLPYTVNDVLPYARDAWAENGGHLPSFMIGRKIAFLRTSRRSNSLFMRQGRHLFVCVCFLRTDMTFYVVFSDKL